MTGIVKQRVSAKEAVLLYTESTESLDKREKQIEIKRDERKFLGFQKPEHKPNKKNRDLIHQFKRAE